MEEGFVDGSATADEGVQWQLQLHDVAVVLLCLFDPSGAEYAIRVAVRVRPVLPKASAISFTPE
eukprot:140081-Amphidinium_carterae.1